MRWGRAGFTLGIGSSLETSLLRLLSRLCLKSQALGTREASRSWDSSAPVLCFSPFLLAVHSNMLFSPAAPLRCGQVHDREETLELHRGRKLRASDASHLLSNQEVSFICMLPYRRPENCVRFSPCSGIHLYPHLKHQLMGPA